jgi:hypothetical protein
MNMGGMKGTTTKLAEVVSRQLGEQACQSGVGVAAVIRERTEAAPRGRETVYALSADLAGSLAGRPLPATNARAKSQHP